MKPGGWRRFGRTQRCGVRINIADASTASTSRESLRQLGALPVRAPGARTDDYLLKGAQEVELRRRMEEVAALRRASSGTSGARKCLYAPTDPGQDPRHVGTIGAALEYLRPGSRGAWP
jgi:hypothetical protein